MKAVLVILAVIAVMVFTGILGILAAPLLAICDAENVNKDPENVNKVNEKSEDAKTDDLGKM